MKHYSKLFKRVQAWVLTIAMLLPLVNSGLLLGISAADETLSVRDKVVTSEGKIVADNYALSDAEKELLKSGQLVGKTISIEKPNDEDGLVSVDKDTKVVTADEFSDGDYTWIPVSAVYAFNGQEVSVKIEDGKANAPEGVGNVFSVKVTYQVYATVEEEAQSALLNAAGYLKQGLANFEAIDAASSNLGTIEQAIGTLRLLANGIEMDLGFAQMNAKFGEAAALAVDALEAQTNANDGKFDLNMSTADYRKATSKLQYVVGNDIYDMFMSTYGHVYAIANDPLLLNQTLDLYLESQDPTNHTLWMAMKNIISSWVDDTTPYTDESLWELYDVDLVKDGADWAALESKLNAITEVTPAPAIKNPLLVAETVIQYNMEMYNVDVTVVMEIVDANQIVKYDSKSTRVTLGAGATAQDILAAIEADGVEANAIGEWTREGKYDSEHFVVNATELPASLEDDVTYVVTYSPKMYTVTYKYDSAVELPYGWKILLPIYDGSAEKTVYDYTVTMGGITENYYQGDKVLVSGDMEIDRVAGKDYDWPYNTLNKVIGIVYYGENDKASAILNSGALNVGLDELKIRVPDAAWADENVTISEDNILHAPDYASGYKGLKWVAVDCDLYDNQGKIFEKNVAIVNGEVDLSGYTGYARAVVNYELALDHFDDEDILKLYNLPALLAAEATAQKNSLESLKGQKGNLEQLDRTKLGALSGVIGVSKIDETIKDEFTAVINGLVKNCLDSNDKLELYNLIAQYDAQGLAYYYKNHLAFKDALAELSGYLDILVQTEAKREALAILVSDAGFPEYAEKIQDLQQKMQSINSALTAPNAAINTSSDSLQALVNALAMDGDLPTADRLPDEPAFALHVTHSAIAPTQASADVSLNIGGSVTKLDLPTHDLTYLLQESDIQTIKDMIAEAVKGIDAFFYSNNYDPRKLDAYVGKLASDVEVSFEWTAYEFEIIVPGYDETVKFTIKDLQAQNGYVYVDLLPSTFEGIRYEYTIDGEIKRVEGNAVQYGFTTEQVKRLFNNEDRKYEIVRAEIDVTEEKLENFVNGLNESVGSDTILFALTKDVNGNYSIIMNIDGSAPNALTSALTGMAMGFVNSGYSYIALDNNAVLEMNEDGQLSISLQAVIDAVMNSGFSTDVLVGAMSSAGVISHMDMPGDVLAGNIHQAGAELIKTGMSVGSNNLSAIDVDFYITLGNASDELVQLRNLFDRQDFLSMEFKDGKSIMHLSAPDKAYEAYLAGLLITGYLTLDDIDAMEAQIAGKFMFDVVHPLFDEGSSIQTLENTLALFGKDFDLSGLDGAFDMISNNYQNAYESIVFDETTGTVTKILSIKALIGAAGIDPMLASMIKEYETGIMITGSATLKNLNNDYEAAYVDVRAESALDMIGLLKKGQLANKKLSGASIVVLLDNITGNLVFDKTTVLNLNGFTVNGNVKSTGNLTIVDSCMDKIGGVTGTVSGNVTVLGGRYANGLDAKMLADGYELNQNTVHNKFYNFIKDHEGNITVEINAGLLNRGHYEGEIPDVKFMVMELAVDMFFNGYTTNHLEINDNLVYHLGVEDFVGLYTGEDKVDGLVDAVRQMVDIQALVNIMNMIIDDMTDFDALYEALANDQPLFSYDLTTGSWKIVTDRIENGDEDYFTIGIGTGDIKNRKLNIKVVGSDEDKQHLLDILEQFRDTTDVNINLAPFQGSYDSEEQNIVLGWGGYGTVVVDFTKNDNYAVMFGVLLADGLKGTATSDKLVAAIREYYETDNIYALKVAFNAVTVSQLLDTFMDYNRSSDVEAMINALGLADVVSDEVNELEDLFDRYAKVLTAVARRVDNRFDLPESNRTLGSLYNPALNGYGFAKENIEKSFVRDILRGYGIDLTAKIEKVSIVIRIFADGTPPVVDEINYSKLEAAIKAAQSLFADEAKYTPDSWAYMMTKYNEALDALASLDQAVVDAAADALIEAIRMLEKIATPEPEIDYEKLEAAIKAAEELFDHEAEYTTDSWKNMMDAYEAAVAARESKDQAVVDAAADALLEAIKELERISEDEDELDYSALQEKIDYAESLNESKYTTDSWSAMKAVLEEAKALLNNAETQEEIDAMTEKLDQAINALVLADPGPGEDDDEYDPEDYPDGKVEFDKNTHTNVARIYKKGDVYVADAHHATGMTVGAFLEVLRAIYADYTVLAYEADGTTEITDMDRLIFTGAVIKILDGQTVVDQFTAAVLGDLDGDGKQSAKDTYLTKWHAANDATLAEHLSAATDYNNDGVHNAKDSYLAAYKAAHWEDYQATAES